MGRRPPTFHTPCERHTLFGAAPTACPPRGGCPGRGDLPNGLDRAPRVRLHHLPSHPLSLRRHHSEPAARRMRIQPDIPVHAWSPVGVGVLGSRSSQRVPPFGRTPHPSLGEQPHRSPSHHGRAAPGISAHHSTCRRATGTKQPCLAQRHSWLWIMAPQSVKEARPDVARFCDGTQVVTGCRRCEPPSAPRRSDGCWRGPR